MTKGTRRGWGVSVTPRPLFTPGKTRYPFTGGWVGPRAGLDRCRKSRPPPGFDPQTVQPEASRYTDYATRPTQQSGLKCFSESLRMFRLLNLRLFVTQWLSYELAQCFLINRNEIYRNNSRVHKTTAFAAILFLTPKESLMMWTCTDTCTQLSFQSSNNHNTQGDRKSCTFIGKQVHPCSYVHSQ